MVLVSLPPGIFEAGFDEPLDLAAVGSRVSARALKMDPHRFPRDVSHGPDSGERDVEKCLEGITALFQVQREPRSLVAGKVPHRKPIGGRDIVLVLVDIVVELHLFSVRPGCNQWVA